MMPPRFSCAVAILVLSLLWAIGATAQVTPIAEMPVTLSGALTAGYAAGSGAALGGSSNSSNSLVLGVNADLSGSYYDPRFLQFDVSPRFTWTRSGASTAAAMQNRDNGVNVNVNFLQSSNTPIHFSFDLTQVNTATLSGGPTPFTVGASGISKSFSIGASHRFRYLPPLNISYSRSSSDTEVTGTNAPTNHVQHDFLNLFTNYDLVGFHLNGAYTHSTSASQVADLLQLGLPVAPSHSSSDSESFGVSHSLPLNGGASLTASHSTNRYDLSGTPQTGSYDTLGSSVSLAPLRRLTLSAGTSYTSDATQQGIAEVVNGASTIRNVFGTGRSFIMETNANYLIGHGFSVTGSGSRQSSDFPGEQLTQDIASGTLSYARRLWRGTFYASYAPGWNSARLDTATARLSTAGFYHVASGGYQRQLGRWSAQGSFSYTHNSASLGDLAPILAHSFSITGRARTRIRYNWNLSLSALLGSSQAAGRNSNGNQLFSGQIANRTWSLNGQWQRNSGYFLSTTSGIIGLDTTATAPPGVTAFYNTSTGETLAGSYTRRRMTLLGSYSRTAGNFDTLTKPVTTANSYFEAKAYYKLRKLDFQGGFRRLTQSASTSGLLGQMSNAYWISVVRQFHAF